MKGRRIFVAGATIVVLALVTAYGGRAAHAWQRLEPVSIPSAPAGDAAAVARGAKLAAIGDCIGCHTALDGQPFAGGLPLQTPYGVIYSTNITPDKDTGIGLWSLDAFTRAMRHGVSRDGHLLYPAFPYPHFTRMNDTDIASLYAWLMSREPISARAPKNELQFPLGFRPIMAAWNLLYLHPGPEEPSSSTADPQVARGRYLVDSVGHCGACHTPLNRQGAEQRDRALQGGTIEGWDAPALTDLSTRPRPWTQAQLVGYLRTGFASEHGASAGPMRPVTRLLADASAEDVQAIAAYLIALQSNAHAAPGDAAASSASSTNSASSISHVSVAAQPGNGASLFVAACASCHGDSAPMSGGPGHPSLSLGTAINADSPRNMVRIILDGIDWDDSASAQFMPPFASVFTDAQIADLANYTRTRFTARGAWPSLDADAVARLRKESPQR
ncbi:c-type cytochrome [Paraburkholderia diazotrophica]|uniref:Cytochrome c, mono-and diheme variants n=1 Tax=Paraburkholderia diazotrophica TaxID=667676 RepID=A0A1H7BAZ8_9BURK|nr:cytochrome c [Paraburkholderia diazotrophica]SEJ74853.1 Cytochrome c, mono-and diheme variants [Paraburkholderia diazotrophica]